MVRALCIGPCRRSFVFTVLMMLAAGVTLTYPRTYAGAVRIIPSTLQLFERESVKFMCEGTVGLHGWRVKSSSANRPRCWESTATTAAMCSIAFAYPSDTGEYWCEGGGHRSSNNVSITVAGGSVVLESPVHQLRTGDAATLRCRHKGPSFNATADFYKDGRLLLSSTSDRMTIRSVSKSDEGRYRCGISRVGESAESWLTVNGASEADGSAGQRHPSHRTASQPRDLVLLWSLIVTTLVLQLLVLGLLYLKKQLVLTEAHMEGLHRGLAGKFKDTNDADNMSIYFHFGPVTARDNNEDVLLSFFSSFN